MDLPRSTQSLLRHLPAQVAGPMLDIGSRDGAVAAFAIGNGQSATYMHLDWTACNRAAGSGAILHHSDILPPGPFALVMLDATAFEPAYAQELAQQAAGALAPGGSLISVPPTGWAAARWQELLTAAFTQVGLLAEPARQGDPPVFVAAAPAAPPPPLTWDTFRVTWEERQLEFSTGAGVFSPRGLDPGTRALLEAVPRPAAATHLLDLGCGTGTVAVVAAAVWGCRVTAVDVNARALRLTALNAARNGVADRVTVQVSDGVPTASTIEPFDLILSNPPYHTDYAVAKRFIAGAWQALRPGGSLWLVVKKADWYREKLRHVFGGCRVVERDGYTILAAERREQPAAHLVAKPAAKLGSKKHRKRLEEAARWKRR